MDDLKSNLDVQLQAKRARRLARHVWTHFQEDRCLEEAASLSYTSLLSLVPLLAVMFGIIAAFPVFNEWSEKLQSIIFENFMPATGEQIVPYLNTFLESVTKLTLPGMLVLIITALLLMIRIETAFNRIWRVEQNRTLVNRVVMYWAVLTLAPVMIAAGIAFSAQKVFGLIGSEGAVSPGVYRSGIFVLTWLMFTTVFLLVPNRRVQIKHALGGALLTTVLFELAKAGFVGYAANTNYTVIYGAVALVPIFFFWIYLVWNVVLIGASLAASLTTFSDYSRYETHWPEKWEFQMAYRLVGHFWAAQQDGEPLSRERVLELETQASELQLMKLIGWMREEKILAQAGDDAWVLARDLEEFTLADLYRSGHYFLPLGSTEELPRENPWDPAYVECLATVRDRASEVWQRPLRHFYLQNDKEGND